MKVTNKKAYEIKQDKYKEKHSQVYHNVVAETKDKEKIFKKWRGAVRSETRFQKNNSWLSVGFSIVMKVKDNGMAHCVVR